MRTNSYIAFTFIAITAIFVSCSKSSSSGGGGEVKGFDKTGMLINYADNLIIPGYAVMQEKVSALQTASNAFLSSPSETTLAPVKEAYNDAYLQYEKIAAFQFGPAETALLDVFLNYSGGLDYSFATAGELTGFSIDSTTIESNIASGHYTLTDMSRNSLYSQGFPALNYLLFSPGAVSKFSTNTAGRVQYVKDIVARIKSLVDQVASGWTTYRAEFIANTKTNIGSPIGNMVNQFAYQLDLLKGPRIGWPFGKQSNGIVFATKCEAYFTGTSLSLAIGNLSALKNDYSGGPKGNGIGDYLVALGKASLNNDVLSQFDAALSKLREIPAPLSTSFESNAASVDEAYREIQKLLTLLKTDVASATAVQITFMDNDGD